MKQPVITSGHTLAMDSEEIDLEIATRGGDRQLSQPSARHQELGNTGLLERV